MFILMVRVRMDDQRRIRIPKKAELEGDTFLLLIIDCFSLNTIQELDGVVKEKITPKVSELNVIIINKCVSRWQNGYAPHWQSRTMAVRFRPLTPLLKFISEIIKMISLAAKIL